MKEKDQLNIRVTPELAHALRVEAATAGVRLSEYVAELLERREVMKGTLPPLPQVSARRARDQIQRVAFVDGELGIVRDSVLIDREGEWKTDLEEAEPPVRGCVDHRGDPEDWCEACLKVDEEIQLKEIE